MGSEAHYREEGPRQKVRVDAFWIDKTAVTNAAFAAFVNETGYVTAAEREINRADYPDAEFPELLIPASLVFQMPPGPVDLRDFRNWWRWTPGATWAHPEGPGSSIVGREDHPVVHVAHEDAAAYASWSGKTLPTEAEWEYAARGGLDQAEFAWGDHFPEDAQHLANIWVGQFPWKSLRPGGKAGTCAVKSYPANGFGLYEVCGNVWEWTDDLYVENRQSTGHSQRSCCGSVNQGKSSLELSFDPHQPQIKIPRKTVKGGSFLCAQGYCQRYRPSARQGQMIDSSMSHLGFRCIRRK